MNNTLYIAQPAQSAGCGKLFYGGLTKSLIYISEVFARIN